MHMQTIRKQTKYKKYNLFTLSFTFSHFYRNISAP